MAGIPLGLLMNDAKATITVVAARTEATNFTFFIVSIFSFKHKKIMPDSICWPSQGGICELLSGK